MAGGEAQAALSPPFDFEQVQALVHRAGLASSHKDYAASARLYAEASALMGAAVNVVLQQRMGDALMHTGDYDGTSGDGCLCHCAIF
jgi:hypothetical protein